MPTPDHLQLARLQLPPAQRRKVSPFVPRNVQHDHRDHATKLAREADNALKVLQARRAQDVDFDPKLMLRFELNRRIADADWRPAGLTLLDSSDKHAAVVFAARSDLDRFRRRLTEYAAGPRERPADRPAQEDQDEELAALYEAFFDAIDEFRPLEPADRISDRLAEQLDAAPEASHEFDVEQEKFHSDWYVVVRSLNKWMSPDAPPQPYALTTTLEVERDNGLYVELEAEVRIELDARLRASV